MTRLKHRLKGSAFRSRPSGTVQPHRIIFLSVEGKRTEPHYFRGLNRAIARGKIPFPRCMIQILDRHDDTADPGHVILLLEEYLDLRNEQYRIFPAGFRKECKNEIHKYFRGCLRAEEKIKLENKAKRYGISLKDLRELCGLATDNDIFGIVIDHDHRSDLKRHIDYCQEKGYNVFLSSPCFELWLLMHFVDIKAKYNLVDLFDNKRVSNQHTFVSRELSKIAGTNKTVDFERYKDKLLTAIDRGRQLETDVYALLENPGTNLPLLFEIISGERESMWERLPVGESAAAEDDCG